MNIHFFTRADNHPLRSPSQSVGSEKERPLKIRFFTHADNYPARAGTAPIGRWTTQSGLVRAMKDWPEAWDKTLQQLMPTVTNHQIAKKLGATPGLVGFRIQKLGLTRTPEQHEQLYGTLRGRLVSGMNVQNQQAPGTCKWILKHPKRPSERPEWWIFLGKGERMPLRRWLWQTWIGPIPKGWNVCFADRDSKRCTLQNLICIPNREMADRNRNLIKQGVTMRAYWKTPEGRAMQQRKAETLRKFWRSVEGQQVIARKVEKMKTLNAAGLINNPFRNLHDHVIAYYLAQDEETRQYIVAHRPDLIELKRAELLLKRTIKNQTHEPESEAQH